MAADMHNAAQGRPVLLATGIGSALVLLNVTVVNVATPYIGAVFASSVTGLQWIVNAYTLAFASFLMPAGAAADRYGSRIIFVAGMGLFAAASVACALSPSLLALIVARAFLGMAAALIIPSSLALLSHAYGANADASVKAIGIWSAVGGAVSASGPALGGAVIYAFGWQCIFLLNVPLCAIGILMIRKSSIGLHCSESAGSGIRSHLLAVVFFSCLTAAFMEAGARGWGDPWIVAGLAVSAAAGMLFAFFEKKADPPILPPHIVRNPDVLAILCAGVLTNLAFYGLIFVLSIYFQKVRGYSVAMAGVAFLPFMAIMLGNLLASPAIRRYGFRIAISAGLALTLSAYLFLGLVLDARTPYILLFLGLLAIAVGGGLTIPALTSCLLHKVDRTYSATISGLFNTGRQAGAALGVALYGSLLSADDSSALASSVVTVFLVSAGLLLPAMLLAVVLLTPDRPVKAVCGIHRGEKK